MQPRIQLAFWAGVHIAGSRPAFHPPVPPGPSHLPRCRQQGVKEPALSHQAQVQGGTGGCCLTSSSMLPAVVRPDSHPKPSALQKFCPLNCFPCCFLILLFIMLMTPEISPKKQVAAVEQLFQQIGSMLHFQNQCCLVCSIIFMAKSN